MGTDKKAIAIALSLLAKYEPCVRSRIKKAPEMGRSQEEIDEASGAIVARGCASNALGAGCRTGKTRG